MRRFFVGFLICFALPKMALSQIDRAGALDDTSSKCRGLTCSWASAAPIHQHIAGYEFYLNPVPDDSPGSLVVARNGSELLRTELKDISASVTITCALRCNTFAVTWSDGGAIGGFHVRVFTTYGKSFFETNAIDNAAKQFKSHHDCSTRGNNIQAYRFEGSETLLLVLSVYPTSDCGAEMGHTEGYFVRISDGKVVRTITNAELSTYMKHHPEGS